MAAYSSRPGVAVTALRVATEAASVRYAGATRVYPGSNIAAVDALDLDIEPGELMVLVGPSGSGKSTALRMLAGLEDIDGGEILVAGEDVTLKPPKDRDIAMVFQNYALYPHMSVAENMGFALKISGVSKAERDERVRETARLLELDMLLERKPKALSGGQRQRVAMGRAIIREPRVFLMDEPLSNLDAMLRVETRANIAALQARLGTTTIYVTHDQVEAMTMGHRVAVLRDGSLQQVDTPRNLYERPCNVFVAGFIGSPSMNLLTAEVTDGAVTIGGVVSPLPGKLAGGTRGMSSVIVGLRPEAFAASTDGGGLPLVVSLVEELGADTYVYGSIEGTSMDKPLIARLEGRSTIRVGETIRLRAKMHEAHVFDLETGRSIL
jgi:multiple sugar transport system ATP-binding protein